jgi:hypothetical protein
MKQGEYEVNCTTPKILYETYLTENTFQYDTTVTLVQSPLLVFTKIPYFE